MILGVVSVALVGTVTVGGCGSSRQATGFCAAVRRGNSAFNSTDPAHAKQALAAFERVAAAAPPSVAPDLATIAAVVGKPTRLVKNPALVKQYFRAIGRVDRYLHQSCGLTIPPPGKLF